MDMENENVDITIETNQTLDTMLHQIINQALVAIKAEGGSFMLVDNKQGILQIKARLGKPRPRRKTEAVYKIGENSVAGWVVQNKQSYLCADVEADMRFAPSRSGKNFRSLLSVPIIHGDKVVAVINADASEPNYFTEIHRAQLEAVASKIAGPIAERISILAAIAEVGFELTRLPQQGGGVELVLEKIGQAAVRSLGADVVTLYQYVQERDDFPVEGKGPTIAGEIWNPTPMRRRVYAGDVPWTVVKERRSGFYSDVHEQEFLNREVQRPELPRPRFIEREDIKSMAALLLPFRAADLKEEEVVGVMFVNYRTKHDFNIDEISGLATFADYAAVAILNARYEERRHAEQMRMVESISANFAHRMSNLGGTSRVATQILREHIDPNDQTASRQLARIETEAKVLLELADRLARPFQQTGRMLELTPIDISKVIESEIERIKPDLGPNINLTVDLAANLPKIQSVDFQLRQVLHDIVNNAVEAIKEQVIGELTIRARHNRATNQLEIDVSDNGPGIHDDIRPRLFGPGVTAKKDKLGIGLWWCRTFLQATGGDVRLKETRSGEGTTFLIAIPCVSEGETNVVPEQPQAIKEHKDILIVDDRRRWRETLVDALEGEQYTIETSTSYAEATHALAKTHFRLMVVDARLVDADQENKDGLRLLDEIDRMNLDTKVIIVTGYGTDEMRQIAGKSPRLLAFVNKPEFEISTFRQIVRSAIGRT